jgi:hypothetical protein
MLFGKDIVLTGSFSSGIAALQWADIFQLQTKGKINILADGSYFLNYFAPKYQSSVIENRLKSL